MSLNGLSMLSVITIKHLSQMHLNHCLLYTTSCYDLNFSFYNFGMFERVILCAY